MSKKYLMGADLWFWLLILTFLIFWLPKINVLPSLTTGDFGRDLYAFHSTYQGGWPCRDYWWQYGPFMPLYYAFWLGMAGVNILSVRMGLAFIYLLNLVIAYRTLRLFTLAPVAFLSSLALLNMDMTWTFNHIGAIPLILLSIFSLWKFFLTHRKSYCYWGLVSVIVITWIKISTGVTFFFAFYTALLLYCGLWRWRYSEKPLDWRHFILLPLLFGLFALGAYVILYWGIPLDWIGQCLTLAPKYGRWVFLWINVKHLLNRFFFWERGRIFWVAAFLILGVLALFGFRKKDGSETEKKVYPFVWGSLVILGLASSVDYFTLEGMIQRFDFWVFPVYVLSMGLLAEGGRFLFRKGTQVILGGFIFLILLGFSIKDLRQSLALKVPERFLDFPRGQVYAGGALGSVQTIKEGTRFILEHTAPHQEILAIPYEPLYAFLSGRRHALRQLIFVEGIHILPRQEEEMIGQLEEKQVPLFILSNRYYSSEPGIGYFGKTHCQKLNQYLMDHYREVRTFGLWQMESSQHAIKIFERKPV